MKRTLRIIAVTLMILILALVVFFFARNAVASAEVERFYQADFEKPVFEIGSTARLEILPLYEESSRTDGLQWGHGVSYLVITDQATVLVDVGNNPENAAVPPLRHNMEALLVDIEDIDVIFLSHPHPDHLGGQQMWMEKTFTLDGQAASLEGKQVYVPAPLTYPGITPNLAIQPVAVAPGLATSGILPYVEVFPLSLFAGAGGEQVLVIQVTGKGLVVITGCGHPSLERIVERVEQQFEQPVIGILGGLHYEGKSVAEVEPHIRFLQSRNPQLVALSPHDSSPEAIHAFQSAFPNAYQEIHVGEMITFSK